MTFAERLAEERKAAGLSQVELADRAGLTRQSVSRYEAGLVSAASGGAQSIADALGVTVADLLTDSPHIVDVFVDCPPGTIDYLAEGNRRIARWPETDGTTSVFRTRLTALPDVLDACGRHGLPNPRVRELSASSVLIVIVDDVSRSNAIARVLRDTTRVGFCPPVSASRCPTGWLARLRNIPARHSIALQSIIPSAAPVGMYVPEVR